MKVWIHSSGCCRCIDVEDSFPAHVGYQLSVIFKRPPESSDLSAVEQLWDVVGSEICVTDLQQLCDAAM